MVLMAATLVLLVESRNMRIHVNLCELSGACIER